MSRAGPRGHLPGLRRRAFPEHRGSFIGVGIGPLTGLAIRSRRVVCRSGHSFSAGPFEAISRGLLAEWVPPPGPSESWARLRGCAEADNPTAALFTAFGLLRLIVQTARMELKILAQLRDRGSTRSTIRRGHRPEVKIGAHEPEIPSYYSGAIEITLLSARHRCRRRLDGLRLAVVERPGLDIFFLRDVADGPCVGDTTCCRPCRAATLERTRSLVPVRGLQVDAGEHPIDLDFRWLLRERSVRSRFALSNCRVESKLRHLLRVSSRSLSTFSHNRKCLARGAASAGVTSEHMFVLLHCSLT